MAQRDFDLIVRELTAMEGPIHQAIGHLMPSALYIRQIAGMLSAPAFQEFDIEMRVAAALRAISMELLPDGRDFVFVPRSGKRGRSIQVTPQWHVFARQMQRAHGVADIAAELVHVNDRFEYHAATNTLIHEYDPLDENRTITSAKDIRGGYLKFTMRDMPPKYHFVTVAHIERCRKCAEDQGTWSQWYALMARKVLYRDAYARRVVQLDPAGERVLSVLSRLDDAALGNVPVRRGTTESIVAEQLAKLTGRAPRGTESCDPTEAQDDVPDDAYCSDPIPEETVATPPGSEPATDGQAEAEAEQVSEYVGKLAQATTLAEANNIMRAALRECSGASEARAEILAACRKRIRELSKN